MPKITKAALKKAYEPPVYFLPSPPKEDRVPVRFCPSCGRKPEEVPGREGKHIWSVRCEKCQACFTVWVIR